MRINYNEHINIIHNLWNYIEYMISLKMKDIHDLFSPDTEFYPGAGSWGAQGMIRVPNTLHDYIFLVTYYSSINNFCVYLRGF